MSERIGRYEIVSQINAGGMGSVFLGHDPQLHRQVAIKLLLDTLETEEWRRRFHREARALARLAHPNIVTIFDFGEDERQRPYIVMEYVEGRHLGEMITTPLSLVEKLRFLELLCDGLSCAHQAGITHLDIKPANLIIEPSGRLKIVDFGIARSSDSRMMTKATVSQVQAGTPSYMAPELFQGQAIGAAADQFAAGAVAYELLCGRRAFEGTLREIAMKICAVDPPAPSQINPSVDRALDVCVMRALSKEPEQRFPSMEAMGRSLARIRERLDSHNLATLPGVDVADSDLAPDTLTAPFPPRPSRVATQTRVDVALSRHDERAAAASQPGRKVHPAVWGVGGAVAAGAVVWMLTASRGASSGSGSVLPVETASVNTLVPAATASSPGASLTPPRPSSRAAAAIDPRLRDELQALDTLKARGGDVLAAIESALVRFPGSAELGAVMTALHQDARDEVARHRAAAAAALGTPGYEDAVRTEQDAAVLSAQALLPAAIRKLRDAADLFAAAADGTRGTEPTESRAPAVDSKRAPQTDEAVRAPLMALSRAYRNLSGAAVKAAYPGLAVEDIRALDRSFIDYSAYELAIQDLRVTFNGARAMVTCTLQSNITLRNGSERRSSAPARFTLEGHSGAWTIVEASRLP